MQLKDVIHYYLGCPCTVQTYYGGEKSVPIKGVIIGFCKRTMRVHVECFDVSGIPWPETIWYKIEDVTPILRRLEDITDEDAIAIAKICDNGFIGKANPPAVTRGRYISISTKQCDDVSLIRIWPTPFNVERIHEDNPGNKIVASMAFRIFQYLLSRHYDLFNQIESGDALDAKTIEKWQQS